MQLLKAMSNVELELTPFFDRKLSKKDKEVLIKNYPVLEHGFIDEGVYDNGSGYSHSWVFIDGNRLVRRYQDLGGY